MVFRVAMFCLVGGLVLWVHAAGGAPGHTLPWLFVFGGLGAVAAIDLRAWWRSRRREQQLRDGRGPGPDRGR